MTNNDTPGRRFCGKGARLMRGLNSTPWPGWCAARPASRTSAVEYQLQAVPVRVVKKDATVVAGAVADRDPEALQLGLQALVGTPSNVKGEMVEVIADGQRRVALLFEQGHPHPLPARLQKHPPVILAGDGHTQDFGVKRLRTLNIAAMQHDVVDATCPDHLCLLRC
jgi:hypothetical protein